MRRKKLLLVFVALAMLATLVLATGAGAKTERYPYSATFTFTLVGINTHTYDVVFDCDGNFEGTGPGTGWGTETITGSMTDGAVTFTAVYDDGGPNGIYEWGTDYGAGPLPLDGTPVVLGDNLGTPLDWPVVGSISDVWPRNHGQFVSEMGGGPEFAQACFGKPIKP